MSSERDRVSSQTNLPTRYDQAPSLISNDFVGVLSPSPQEDIQIHLVPSAPPIDTGLTQDLPPPTYEEAIKAERY